MSKPADGGPAFPTDRYYEETRIDQRDGMTLRDYFAAAALQCAAVNGLAGERWAGHTAAFVYQIADAMLAERGKSRGN